MNKNKLFICCILAIYAFLYLATSVPDKCDDDCQKRANVFQQLLVNRPYVSNLYRCTNQANSDTLCVYVRDTTGIDWNLFADTVCMTTTQSGLPRQKIFVLKFTGAAYDTVAKKVCP